MLAKKILQVNKSNIYSYNKYTNYMKYKKTYCRSIYYRRNKQKVYTYSNTYTQYIMEYTRNK